MSFSSPSGHLWCRAVLRPCSAMGHWSFTITGTESDRRCLSLSQASWGNLGSNPLRTRRKENLQPPASNPLVPYLSFHCHHLFPGPALGRPSHVLSGLLSLLAFGAPSQACTWKEEEGTSLKDGHRIVSQAAHPGGPEEELQCLEGQARPRQPVPVFFHPSRENGHPPTKPPCCSWGK